MSQGLAVSSTGRSALPLVLLVLALGLAPAHAAAADKPTERPPERTDKREPERPDRVVLDGDERPTPGMKARVFQLKHRDPDDLFEAIRPLLSDARGTMVRRNDSLKTITARDFPENLAAVEQALRRLDQPKPPQPDVEVQIRVLIGAPAGGGRQYPEELAGVVKQLGTTLAYKSYHLVASVTQRLRAGAGTAGKGQLELAPPLIEAGKGGGHFHYNVENLSLPSVPAGAATTLAVKRLKFVLESDALGEAEVATGLTLREGEKVVVGTGSLKDRGMIVVFSARVLR